MAEDSNFPPGQRIKSDPNWRLLTGFNIGTRHPKNGLNYAYPTAIFAGHSEWPDFWSCVANWNWNSWNHKLDQKLNCIFSYLTIKRAIFYWKLYPMSWRLLCFDLGWSYLFGPNWNKNSFSLCGPLQRLCWRVLQKEVPKGHGMRCS